jgi:hypothetical protein
MQHDVLRWRHNMQYLNEFNLHKYHSEPSEDCFVDVETKHGTYMSYTSKDIGHRAHRLFPFLECKCEAQFILMFTADKWIKMQIVPLYRKMHPYQMSAKGKPMYRL